MAMQRVLSLTAAGRTHAVWHQAVVGSGDYCHLEWRLYEVLLQ